MKSKFSLDRLGSIDPFTAGQTTMSILDKLQNAPAEHQVAAASILFLLITEHHSVHAGNALQIARNILDRSKQRLPELRAAVDYVRNEL